MTSPAARARAYGSATIAFGLVTIAVKLFTATAEQRVHLHKTHKGCGSRLRQQTVCPACKDVVAAGDTAQAFEVREGQLVPFTDAELDALEAERTGRLEILRFVPELDVDPVYFAGSVYLGPGPAAERAYALLGEVMVRSGRVALARHWARGKSDLVVLRPYRGALVLHKMWFADEVRSVEGIGVPEAVAFVPGERELAEQLVEQLAGPFTPSDFHDEFRERMLKAVERKVYGGGALPMLPAPQKLEFLDLFAALKQSLEAGLPASVPANATAPAAEVAPSSSSSPARPARPRRAPRARPDPTATAASSPAPALELAAAAAAPSSSSSATPARSRRAPRARRAVAAG